MKKEINVWFKRKTYGYGWVPASFMGWVVLGVYAFFTLVILSQLANIDSPEDIILRIVFPMLVATGVLIAICFKKGESPRWQWGERR